MKSRLDAPAARVGAASRRLAGVEARGPKGEPRASRGGWTEGFSSLLLEELHVRLPGVEALSLMVHRHLDETARVAEHAHPWSQAIVYLTGHGRQWVEGVTHAIEPGSLVMLPPRVRHSFQRAPGRRPLCLLVDFRWERGVRAQPAVVRLAGGELERLRADLAELMRWEGGARRGGGGRLRHLQSAAAVLRVLSVALEAAGWVEPPPARAAGGASQRLREFSGTVPLEGALGEIAAKSGFHRDHLNRLLRKETGQTLGQLRAARRLERARELLGQGWRVGAVAAEVGMPDQNYFARWFRRQTGVRPSEYREGKA